MNDREVDWVPFMDAVDECRRKRCVEPLRDLLCESESINALIYATAWRLSSEMGIGRPKWYRRIWLRDPWFVSGVENLKAMALVESPVQFRSSNIFVLNNFLFRV